MSSHFTRDEIAILKAALAAEYRRMFDLPELDAEMADYYRSVDRALTAVSDWLAAHRETYPVTLFANGRTSNHRDKADGIAAALGPLVDKLQGPRH